MNLRICVDVFPVMPQSLPPLFGYTIRAASDAVPLGGKLANRLKNKFGGTWVWCSGQIISDIQVQDEATKDFLRELWGKEEETLKDIQSIAPNPNWNPSAWEQGDFAARGLLANFQNEIQRILAPKKQ